MQTHQDSMGHRSGLGARDRRVLDCLEEWTVVMQGSLAMEEEEVVVGAIVRRA